MKIERFPTLETKRLLLRRMTIEDAPAVLRLFSDPEVTKDMGMEPFTSIEQAEGLIGFMNGLFDDHKALRWAVIRKEDGVLIGTCGFNGWEVSRGSRAEIGYDLGREHWRQGYMTEVLKEVLSYGFGTLGLNRIEAYTNLDALPSMKLLERLGFTEEGILRGYALSHGEYVDNRCYSILRSEWEPQEK
ncbi:GNAT family N-acetyltransferase [Paenibacillus caseinilyticus]|nr:GNAT family protein [Paenibacillus mucilaginosus]